TPKYAIAKPIRRAESKWMMDSCILRSTPRSEPSPPGNPLFYIKGIFASVALLSNAPLMIDQPGSSRLDKWQNLVIALAGITQAVDLMDKLAKTGYLNSADFEICVNSLFEQNPSSTEAVFGGANNLTRGYEVLVELLR